MALIMSGVFNVLQLVAITVCFLIIDVVGRRPLAIFGGFGTAIAYTIISVLAGLYSDDWSSHSSAGWACVAMAFVFILIYGASYAPLGWALPPEVYTTSSRSKGVALSTCTNWLCNFIIGVAVRIAFSSHRTYPTNSSQVPPMMADIGWGTYVFFAFWCLVAGFWAVFLLPETMGKTLEQIDELFGDLSGQEEREIMREAVAYTQNGQL